MSARHVEVEIYANGKNITADISTYVTAVSYTDAVSDEANVAEITLQDVNHIWRESWFPQRGDEASINLVRVDWNGGDEIESLPLGKFEIDEFEYESGSGGNVAKVKLNSIPNSSGLKSVNESRSWEKVKLSKIAQDIAVEAKMELFYDATDDPEIERAEQSEKSNLAFLQKLCKDNYLILTVAHGKLVICDEKKLEDQEPVCTLTYGSSAIKRFSAKATISKIYKSCEVNYKHGKKSEEIGGKFDDPTKSKGMTLKINKKVSSQAEAEKLARNELRQKNKEEVKITLSLIGNFLYLSGNVIQLAGYGEFDGRYIIEKASHKIGSGYSVDIEVRKCLNF